MITRPIRSHLTTAMLAGSLCVATAHSAEIGPDGDLRAAIAALEAGETLELLDGEYVFTSAFRVTAVGTEEAPVVIRAKAGHSPLLNMDTPAQNVMEVRDSRYLEVRGLRLTGGSHGVRLMNSDYVTIADCEIFETGDVAISANSGGTYTGLKILRNHIYHTNGTGEGMYLGCNNDECRVEQSLIEGNYVHHTNRDTVEQGDGIELKEGSSGNIIRHNVVHDTNYPNILVYGTAGNGPANIIEGNVLWNTDAWNLQAAADAVIRNNVILGDVGIQPHQSSVPANIEFVHNTVLFQETPLWVRGVVGPITIANNALYAQSGAAVRLVSGDLSLVTLSGNMGTGGVSGGSGGFTSTNGIDSDLVDASFGQPPMDVFPAPDSALIGAGNPALAAAVDFNETPREGSATVGAYHYAAGGNPGAPVGPGIKTLPAPPEEPPEEPEEPEPSGEATTETVLMILQGTDDSEG